MKSGLRKLRNAVTTPPVPMGNPAGIPGRSFWRMSLHGGPANKEAYLQTYGGAGTVFSIVSLLALSVATPEWHLYRKNADARVRYTTGDHGSDQRVEVLQHAAMNIWQQPNDFMTRFEFVEGFQQHLELTGEAWWVLNYGPANFPIGMWYIRPDRMAAVPGTDQFIQGYVYTGENGEQVPLNTNEVIMLKYPNPTDPFSGLGPVQSVLPDIDAMKYSAEYNKNFFLNSAIPEGLIQVDKRLSDSEWDELTNRWRETHQGMARAHRVGVLENGAQWVAPASTMKDMDFVNLRAVSRDVLREAWGLHKSMLGNSDDVNRANAQTAEEVFGSWKVVPRLNRIRMTLNQKFLPLFGSTGQGVEFDYENPLPDDREADNAELTAKSAAAQVLVNAGFDPHDVLETVGLPDMNVLERADSQPATPPGWVPEQTPPAGTEPLPKESPSPKDPGPAPEIATNLATSYREKAAQSNGHSGNGKISIKA